MTRRQLWAVAIAWGLVAFVAATALDQSAYTKRFKQLTGQLQRETAMMEHWLRSAGDAVDLQSLVDEGADELLLRVTLFDEDGEILADSKNRADGVRGTEIAEELREASQLGVGASIRAVDSGGQRYLFSARRSEAHPQVRYLRVGIRADGPPYFEPRSRFKPFLLFLIVGLAPIALLYWGKRVERRQLTTANQLILSPDQRISEISPDLSDEWIAFVRKQRERDSEQRRRSAELEQRMSSLAVAVSAMREGLLVVDESLRVRLVNRSADRLLGLTEEDLNRSVEQVIRNPTVLNALTGAVESGEAPPTENLTLGEMERIFQLRVTPLHRDDGGVSGALALLFDITQLKTLERVRRDFVANVSHELRTPLTAIKAAVETLLDEPDGPAELRQTFTQMIGRNATAMEGLVEDLTDLTLVETGAVRLERIQFDLAELAQDVAEQLRPVFDATSVQFDLPAPLPVVGDPKRVRQIVVNLLENALKFNRERHPIQISGEITEVEALLHISDQGIGIPATDLENIFNRFYQVAEDRSRARSQRGSGLGLAIVKHLARRHGGSITVQSELGVGSTFTLHLPLDDAANS